MTYCMAWKKEKSIYMIADSTTSSQFDEIISDVNTFGEIQGLYNKYYVQEGTLKIYRITSKIALSFSGIVEQAYEVIKMIYNMVNILPIHEWMNIIENNYGTYNVELIIILTEGQNRNKIFLFSEGRFKSVDRAEIGSGKSIRDLSRDINYIVDELYVTGMEKEYYLAMIIGTIKVIFSKIRFFFKVSVGQ